MRNTEPTTTPSLSLKLSEETRAALQKDTPEITEFRNYLDTGHYRANDVGISYRNLNAVDEAGLIPDYSNLPRGNKWRSFTTREAIYLQILFKLKAFGMTNAKLRGLLDFLESRKLNKYDVFLAYAVDAEITVLLFSDGNGLVLDATTLAEYEKSRPPEAMIMFNLNRQINATLAQLDVGYWKMKQKNEEKEECAKQPN